MEAYYYNRMNRRQQAAYHAMLTGLNSMAPSFSVPLLEGGELFDVWQQMRLDHPEMFFAETFKYRYYEDAKNAELKPVYLFEKKKLIEHQKAMKSRVDKLVRPAKDLGELEKLIYVHDFICKNVYYDKLKKAYSHEIIGPLGQGVGVCEGIAKSVKILCDNLGLWCAVALCGNNPEKGIKYRHMWNVVKIGGKYYHVDATFDNSLGEPEDIRYDYFMLPDKQIFKDHEPLIFRVPECVTGDKFYYKEKKLSFTKLEDVQKRSMQAAKKGRVLTFHWRGGYLSREVLKELVQAIEEGAAKKDKHARVALNWPQAVLRVKYTDELPEQQMIMEEANEGEQEPAEGTVNETCEREDQNVPV